MYLRTAEGLEQIENQYGHLSGTLGEPPLPPTIQKFLTRIKKNPQNYEALLLTVTFHEEPWSSDQLMKWIGETFTEGTDPFETAKANPREGPPGVGRYLQEASARCGLQPAS